LFAVPTIVRDPGTFGMIEYRALFVGNDGHFRGFEPIVCADDAEAIAKAKRLVDGHDVELWSGSRLVVRLKAKGAPGAPHAINP
jgi:hypothetical protein